MDNCTDCCRCDGVCVYLYQAAHAHLSGRYGQTEADQCLRGVDPDELKEITRRLLRRIEGAEDAFWLGFHVGAAANTLDLMEKVGINI